MTKEFTLELYINGEIAKRQEHPSLESAMETKTINAIKQAHREVLNNSDWELIVVIKMK